MCVLGKMHGKIRAGKGERNLPPYSRLWRRDNDGVAGKHFLSDIRMASYDPYRCRGGRSCRKRDLYHNP